MPQSEIGSENLAYIQRAIVTRYKYLNPMLYALRQFGDARGLRDKVLLDFACGAGDWSIYFALNGAKVCSIDIQEKLLNQLARNAKEQEVEQRIDIALGKGEQLPYPGDAFDFVWGNNVLHHCDVGLVSKELQRVMKTGAVAVFVEPVEYVGSALVRGAAKALRGGRSTRGAFVTADGESEHHRSVSAEELRLLRRDFKSCDVHYLRLLSRFDVFLEDTCSGLTSSPLIWTKRSVISFMFNLDRLLVRSIPLASRLCSEAIVVLRKEG